jgi:hypothetical protein
MSKHMPTKKSGRPKAKVKLKPSEETQAMATYIAVVVRNEIEDFHAKYLSDAQMKELNPLIRNATCTALYAFENYDGSDGAKRYVDTQLRMIPDYWEKPQLVDDYLMLVEHVERKAKE